jgi:hypothetical protein
MLTVCHLREYPECSLHEISIADSRDPIPVRSFGPIIQSNDKSLERKKNLILLFFDIFCPDMQRNESC